jgi:hypothetical protein
MHTSGTRRRSLEQILSHYKFREKLVNELVSLKMNEQSKETGEIFERSINKKQWSRERSRRIGVHWIFQARKPKDARVEGLNPSNPSKQRTRNWYRGACVMCGRSIDTKCRQQCRVWLCIELRRSDTNSTCNKEFHTLQNFEDRSDEEEEADEED